MVIFRFCCLCFCNISSGNVTGDSYNRGEKIDGSKFGADPGLSAAKMSSEDEASFKREANHTPLYRCKKCRRLLALQENVVDHLPGEGETSFQWHKRRSGNPFNKPEDNECSSVFVEPLRWMTTGMKRCRTLFFAGFLIPLVVLIMLI